MDLHEVTMCFFDFDGVFTDDSVYVNENGVETVRCSRADGLGISLLHKEGIQMAIISTEENPVVSARAAKLKLPVFQKCEDKAVFLRNYLEKERIEAEHTVYVGNDLNDLEAMRLVKFRACPADARPEILACANIRLNASGGNGAIREFCELIISSRRHQV